MLLIVRIYYNYKQYFVCFTFAMEYTMNNIIINECEQNVSSIKISQLVKSIIN